MMTTTSKLYARAGASAIAAALALSSTPLGAQEAPPTAAPAPTPAPVPTPDVAPVTTAPVTPATEAIQPDPVATAAPATRSTAARKPARTATRAAPRPAPSRTAAPAPAAAAPSSAPAPATERPAVSPIVNLADKPATTASPPASRPVTGKVNETAIELGAGALALLALGGGAYALLRRRRREDEPVDEVYEPEAVAPLEPAAIPRHDPIVHEEQPAIIAPSAFAWGRTQPVAPASDDDDGSDRRPGETWVERAYRGPSPANPSVSLRARLKRAAFFDQREREVAAGTAEPVEADAGLPDAMVEEQEAERERELA